jgi:hypothetical protein
MKPLCYIEQKRHMVIAQGKCVFCIFVFFCLSGCGIWNGYVDPDYESSRADRLCHPYGQCTQGTWVANDGTANDPLITKTECEKAVDQRYGNGWWGDSVARGLEIGNCMEKHRLTLQQ